MAKIFLWLIVLSSFVGCNSSEPKEKDKTEEIATRPSPSLEPFADSLVRLDQFAAEGIDKAGYYFSRLVPADTTLADSAAVMLFMYAWKITDTVNQQLWKDTTDYTALLYPGGDPPTAKQKEFQQGLRKNHLILKGNGEGDAMVTLDNDWLFDVLQPKVSSTVNSFLRLLGKEETEPALIDAELTIDMPELVDRLLASETLLAQHLPYQFHESIVQKNKFYTDILLVGASNTPAFTDELKMELDPEFRKGYNYLLKTYPSSHAAQELNDWLTVLKTRDRKKVEERRKAAYQ